MQSWQILEHGKPLQRTLREPPKPKGTEVLVRVTRCGVCHSDLHLWDGYYDWGGGRRLTMSDRGVVPPITPGHEPFGVVEALGPGAARAARGLKVGQRRLVYPWIGCGKCEVCQSGRENYCLTPRFLGFMLAGGYASHLLVPHPRYLVDASGIDEAFASTLACSALTAYSSLKKMPALEPKEFVVVLGCGGLGLIAISLLRMKGIRNVIACDIDEAKLAAGKKMGARHTLDARDADAAQKLQALAAGRVAAALDYVGLPETAALGIGALRKGGRYVICGLFGGALDQPLPPVAQRAIGIMGSYVGNLAELKEVVALAKKKKLKPLPVTLRPADEVNQVLEELKAGKVLGRAVLDLARVTT